MSLSRVSAERTLPHVFKILPNISTLLDVGCGGGEWMDVSRCLGVPTVQGIDRVGTNIVGDLNATFTNLIGVKYDLVISLEVAEHLYESSGHQFVATLTSLSDYILFSAAIPGQEGPGHINCQWQSYWYEIFKQNGFIGTDYVRRKIYNTIEIPFWYRQNIILYVKENKIETVKIPSCEFNDDQIDIVHRDCYCCKDHRLMHHIKKVWW